MAHSTGTFCQHTAPSMDPFCDVRQPLRAVIYRIHCCDVGQESLCCADVASGFFSADVLFSRLQGQAIGRRAVLIYRYAHDTTRYQALIFFSCGKKGSMRSTKSERYAKTLTGAYCNIGAP